jgi:hypothetical protein
MDIRCKHWDASGYRRGRIATIPCSSYRAEAYGMLSLLRFLYHVSKNITTPTLSAMQISTDSKSLIQKVTQYHQFDHYYSNTTLEPDWDVLQIICTTNKSLPFKLKLIHVKGHQDCQSNHSLSIEAKLNIISDSIATKMHAIPPSQYILFPGSGAYLSINNNIVTSNYNTRISYFSSDKQLRQRHIEKEKWTQDQFQQISW